MVFSSLSFLLYFLPITLIGCFLLPKAAQNYWLLVISLGFYAWGAHEFALVMILSIVINYLFALIIDRTETRARKVFLILAVGFNLGILFYNKYMNFTTELLHRFVSENIPMTQIVLPIGISFFTFQAMSYVIDVYRKQAPVQKNLYYLGLYVSFFPQLVAGPIVRYTTVAEQIENRCVSMKKFRNGVSRFMSGFAAKILLSNTFSVIADEAFALNSGSPQMLSVGFAWIGAIAYTLQIFFDFSGYSSMAIGLGKMFGFDFLENFDYPYISKNVTEFWRRWHMSLGQFFRDYVYFPLGGSRMNSTWKLIRNLFVVWMLTGIWHGADFTFLLWGLWYFLLLCFEKLTHLPKRKLPAPVSALYQMFTLLCVILGWVLFRAEGMGRALWYVTTMFGLGKGPQWDDYATRYLNDYKAMFIIAILFCTPVLRTFRQKMEEKYHVGQTVGFVYDILLVGCVLLAISSLVMGVNNPFIYFNF